MKCLYSAYVPAWVSLYPCVSLYLPACILACVSRCWHALTLLACRVPVKILVCPCLWARLCTLTSRVPVPVTCICLWPRPLVFSMYLPVYPYFKPTCIYVPVYGSVYLCSLVSHLLNPCTCASSLQVQHVCQYLCFILLPVTSLVCLLTCLCTSNLPLCHSYTCFMCVSFYLPVYMYF